MDSKGPDISIKVILLKNSIDSCTAGLNSSHVCICRAKRARMYVYMQGTRSHICFAITPLHQDHQASHPI